MISNLFRPSPSHFKMPFPFQSFVRRAALFFGLLSVALTSSYAEVLTIQTEGEPVVIERDDIPLMYKLENLILKADDVPVNQEFVRFIEGRIFPRGIPADPVEPARQPFLFRYCAALFDMKNYGKALSCLDAVHSSVAKFGDPVGKPAKQNPIQLIPYGIEVNSPGGEYPLSVREPMLRSEIFFELGDIASAVKYADLALENKAKIPLQDLPTPYGEKFDEVLARTVCKDEYMVPRWNMNAACGFGGGGNVSSLTHLAVLYGVSGNITKSDFFVDEFKTQLATFEGSLNKFYRTKRRLALVQAYMARKDYRSALELADDESSVGSDLFNFALGAISIAGGSGVGALSIIAPAIDQHTISTKFQVAHARVEVGRLAEATAYLDEILAREEIKALPGIYWAALYDRGRIAESENKPDEAIALYQSAINEIERQRSTINTESAKIGFFGDKQAVYQALIRLLFQTGRPEEAFLMGERSKSRALVDMLASKQDFSISGPAADKVRQLLNSSQANERALSRDLAPDTEFAARTTRKLQGKADIKPSDITAVVDEIRNLKAEAQVALKTQAPELASLVSVPNVSLADISKALPTDETLVSYYYDNQNLYAFLIDTSGFRAIELKREQLEEDLQAYQQAIEDRSESHKTLGKRLHDRLMAPLENHLHKTKLLITGHGKLHYLPFAALFDGKAYLIDRYQLTYLPSASTLLFLGKPRFGGKIGSMLALGNPDLGDRRYDLPFAEQEAKIVASIFPKSTLLVKKAASKKNLKEYGSGFTYLHFATHGKFDADDPLGSALMLAGSSATEAEDRLTVGELYSMNMYAELVTLSACETGLGKVANGDDVVGLVRGFLYAGANRVVSTLWAIDDRATSVLMAAFYGNLKAGKPKANALREAQIALRGKYPHPFFWAAFQMTGGR